MKGMKRPLLLTLALAVAWLLLGSIEVTSVALRGREPLGGILKGAAGWITLGYLISLVLFQIYAWLERRLHSWRLVAAATLACLVMAVVRILTGAGLWWLGLRAFLEPPNLAWPAVFTSVLWNLVWLSLFSLLYFTISHWLQLEDERNKTLRATALAHQAQLQMLRYQLNPHFLFNALNSIRGMILEDPEKSRRMITTLSEFLRYSLDGDTRETTIGEEVAAIQNYLAIQRIRFERKLEITTAIDPAAETAVIPCFLIHPLVENAIKYGIDTSPLPLRVVIEVSRQNDELRIRVRNSGKMAGVNKATGTGTGLRNITQRLELVYPGQHSFRIYEDDGWVHAEMNVPLEPKESHEDVPSLDRG
jgi:hypothetical protein